MNLAQQKTFLEKIEKQATLYTEATKVCTHETTHQINLTVGLALTIIGQCWLDAMKESRNG